MARRRSHRFIYIIFKVGENIMSEAEYLSVKQYSEKHKIDGGDIRRHIAAGRIAAIKIGNQWAIPANEPRPADKRVKSGNYKDWRKK